MRRFGCHVMYFRCQAGRGGEKDKILNFFLIIDILEIKE